MVLAATDGTAMLLRPGESAASVLEYLAIAKLSTAGSLRGTLSSAIGTLGPGSVVLVTGRAVLKLVVGGVSAGLYGLPIVLK